MGVTEEYFRLINEVKGAQAIADVTKQYVQLQAEAAALKARYQAQTITEEELEKETIRLSAAFTLNAQKFEALTGSVNNTAASARRLTTVVQQSGYALGDLGQTSGDLGMKLSSVTNNIQFMTSQMGPWGVAIGVAAVGAVSLYRNWDLLLGLFGAETAKAIMTVERLTERIKELEAKPHKVGIDIAELERAHKEVDAITAGVKGFEAFKARQGDDTKAAGAGVRDILGAAPGGAEQLGDAMAASLVKQMTATNGPLAEAEKAIADQMKALRSAQNDPLHAGESDLTRGHQIENLKAEISKQIDIRQTIQADISARAKAKVTEAVTGAEAGTGAGREALGKLLDGAGQGGLGEAVRGMTPEEARARRVAEKDAERDRKANKEAAEKAEKEDQEKKRLNLQAKENEAKTKKDFEDKTMKAVEETRKLSNAMDKQRKPEKDPGVDIAEMQRTRKDDAREKQARRNVENFTGGELGKAGTMEAGHRALELQKQGLDALTATQQAVAEQMAMMNGLAVQVEFLRQRADFLTGQAKRGGREMWKAATAPAQMDIGARN